jgi:hypothetical protein
MTGRLVARLICLKGPQKAGGLNLSSSSTHSGGMTHVTRLGRGTDRPALTYINGPLLRPALDAFLRH